MKLSTDPSQYLTLSHFLSLVLHLWILYNNLMYKGLDIVWTFVHPSSLKFGSKNRYQWPEKFPRLFSQYYQKSKIGRIFVCFTLKKIYLYIFCRYVFWLIYGLFKFQKCQSLQKHNNVFLLRLDYAAET